MIEKKEIEYNVVTETSYRAWQYFVRLLVLYPNSYKYRIYNGYVKSFYLKENYPLIKTELFTLFVKAFNFKANIDVKLNKELLHINNFNVLDLKKQDLIYEMDHIKHIKVYRTLTYIGMVYEPNEDRLVLSMYDTQNNHTREYYVQNKKQVKSLTLKKP